MGLAVGTGLGVAIFGLSSPDWLVSSLAVCGASVLPDIDEPDSSVSREFGFVSRWFAKAVNKVAGGHRKLTHSLLGLGIVIGILVPLSFAREASAVMFGLLTATAWRLSIPRVLPFRRMTFLLVGVGSGVLDYRYHPVSNHWFVLFVGLGWLVHMLGDFLTRGGIPLLYPKGEKSSYPIFGVTGSWVETVFATCLYLGFFFLAGFWWIHHAPTIPSGPHIASVVHQSRAASSAAKGVSGSITKRLLSFLHLGNGS